jgi:hypothetical protein
MPKAKQYANVQTYERKLDSVMARMGIEKDDYNYNFDRFGGWVQFKYKGQPYRFEHDIEKAAARGIHLSKGADCFIQIVLSLEDLARMAERGIYELQTWLAGMKYLPPPVIVPDCLRVLGFEEIPGSIEDVDARFRSLAKKAHPDAGGSKERFADLRTAADAALQYMRGRNEK